MLATYRTNQDLINIGAYQRGSDPTIDLAIERFPAMSAFVSQRMDEAADFSTSCAALAKVVAVPNDKLANSP